jgi:hypothetical protein
MVLITYVLFLFTLLFSFIMTVLFSPVPHIYFLIIFAHILLFPFSYFTPMFSCSYFCRNIFLLYL